MENNNIQFFLKKNILFILFLLMSIFLNGCISYGANWDNKPSYDIRDLKKTSLEMKNDKNLTNLPNKIDIKQNHEYSLIELIDLSQNNNPQLNIAWQKAKQAAINSSIIKTTYLPTVSANVIGGYNKNNLDLPNSIDVSSHSTNIIPNVSLQWLIFDFGQRSDLLSANDHLVSALKYNFYLANQVVIKNITESYFLYNQSVMELMFSKELLNKTEDIARSVRKKREMGLATVVEVAQINQLVSESKLNLVIKQNNEKNSYQLLLKAMGVNPLVDIKIKSDRNRVLPKNINYSKEKWINTALSNRPDILASYEMIKNTKSNVSMIEKDALPKVFLGGSLSRNHSNWGVQNFNDTMQTSNNSNIFLGVHIPLYTGNRSGLKIAQAKSLAQEAIEQFNNIKNDAANEIVIGINTLNSALESYQAALDLVNTSEITYNSVITSYKQGFSTITQVNESIKNMVYAKQMEYQAYTSVLISASNLAFLLGFVVNSDAILNSRF